MSTAIITNDVDVGSTGTLTRQLFEYGSKILRDIKVKSKKEISELQESFGKKYEKSQANQSFAKMGPMSQKFIVDTMTETTKVLSIIANMMNYILKDMKTLETTCKKLAKEGKAPNLRK